MNLTLASPILLRAAGAVAIAAAGLALYWLLNRIILMRAQRNLRPTASSASGASAARPSPLPAALTGAPAILYFTTPECAPCRTIQRPALTRLQNQLGDRLQVIEVNAQERPDLASQWGVLSVPTTFIIDPGGQVRQVNHGVTTAEKLVKQLTPLL